MKITITGMPGAGKSTVGKILAEKLKLSFTSIGQMRRAIAKTRSVAIEDYNRLSEDTDTPVDNYQKDFGKNNDNIIVEGRTSFHFIPDSIKIFLDVDLKVAAERIFNDPRKTEKKYASPDELKNAIKERLEQDRNRLRERYNIDILEKGNFDIVVDTTSLTIEQVVEEILKRLPEQ